GGRDLPPVLARAARAPRDSRRFRPFVYPNTTDRTPNPCKRTRRRCARSILGTPTLRSLAKARRNRRNLELFPHEPGQWRSETLLYGGVERAQVVPHDLVQDA